MILHPVRAMGHEAVPLHVIDDAHPQPEALQEAAAAQRFARAAADYYPGLRAPAPVGYAVWLAEAARAIGAATTSTVLRTTFAIATDAPAALAPIQRIPHFDTVDPTLLAAVHYLCAPPHGGTSFYRHRGTGYERIDPSRAAAWRQGLTRDRQRHGLPEPQYPGDHTAGFERIGQADLRFNRLIFYPANCLHAGDLAAAALGADAAHGRLTLTSLLQA
ncbi:DUF6445 family protein [Sphingomonas sp. PAMC 26621]|uniref:DUF6445 family protein n=1 Tax=Sphingomonas sp. PAMC 26621 TaxID=1112213 RepID=UPI000287C80A|nr:DUF6445 family protein [Sphingomonas sp. PAMC 26621]